MVPLDVEPAKIERVLIYLRSWLGAMVLFPLATGFLSALMVLHSLLWGNRRVSDWIIHQWVSFTCWLFGVQIVVEGAANIPTQGCVYLFSHRSFFDIFALQFAVPRLRFGSKIELFSIPVFGVAMKRAGVLPIARQRMTEVIRVYEEAQPRLRAGDQFALAPEGKRNTTSHRLLDFKMGPFMFTIGAKALLVPVVIWGADEVWPKGTFIPQQKRWRSKIILRFLSPIPTAGKSQSDKETLQEQVFKLMDDSLREMEVRQR
ncbi:MAG: 1-acyl-sn-glycerol-3-phosphate acyltransferase [Bdellovibrio sp.]|nr:MAG: 1-acyl-sn-glycerol-3-phosphate acyltransferase [Bdellovibrio sp.]